MPTTPALPPGPSSATLATIRYLRDPLGSMAAMFRRYGDPVTFPSMGGGCVTTGDPDGIKAIFTADPDVFEPFGIESMGPFLGAGSLLLMSGPQHKAARKLLTPPFHGARMRAYGDVMRSIALARARGLSPGQRVKMEDLTRAVSLDVIIVLATLLTHHRFKLAHDREVRPIANAATIAPKGGVEMILEERLIA